MALYTADNIYFFWFDASRSMWVRTKHLPGASDCRPPSELLRPLSVGLPPLIFPGAIDALPGAMEALELRALADTGARDLRIFARLFYGMLIPDIFLKLVALSL